VSWLSALSALWWVLERRPLALVPDKVQVVDVALVTLVKADLVLRPVVLELPVGWRGNNKMHLTCRRGGSSLGCRRGLWCDGSSRCNTRLSCCFK